jgi:hypothetical protein
MNSTKDNKPNHQRNITPNFLRFKSTHLLIKKSQAPRILKGRKKQHKPSIQLKEAHPKQVEAASMFIKREFWI